MNGLTLRINPSSNSKMKNIGFAPVNFQLPESKGFENQLLKDFLNARTVDDQLLSIKKIFDESKTDTSFMNFLALVFLQAEVKHPVKCFIVRHITRSDSLQPAFSEQLSKHIKLCTVQRHSDYQLYMCDVSKIGTCMESFPAGIAAIKLVELELAFYLISCLETCVSTIRSVQTLAPTEKNEIFSLAHLSLRLILCIIQKVSEENSAKFISMFSNLRSFIKELLFDEDSPMDTKSLSGILLLNMEKLGNGPDFWIKILDSSQADNYIQNLLRNEAADLSLHSAIVTVVPIESLQSHHIRDTPALICLTDHIIDIGERTSSESVFSLSVARTIVQISKWLPRLGGGGRAGALASRVAGFCWAHAAHYMDSVRHLAAQGLANVTTCAAALDAKGDPSALEELVSALGSVSRGSKSYYVSVGALGARLPARRLRALLPTAIDDVIHALSLQHVQASASAALEILLERHSLEADTEWLYREWVVRALRAAATPVSPAHAAALHHAMASAVRCDDRLIHYIVPEINRLVSASEINLRSVLVLAQVVRKTGSGVSVTRDEPAREGGAGGGPSPARAGRVWRGLVPYHVLHTAATHAEDDIRILCLSLVAESTKSTEPFFQEELDLILHFLRYNINAQAPNFRQQMLALFRKFLKRLGDSYKWLKRQAGPSGAGDQVEWYTWFVGRLRAQCFASLLPGANYSRRVLALHLLPACQDLHLDGYHSAWREEYVEALLQRLEDSFDGNRALAGRALRACPPRLLQNKKYRVSIELEDILRQASSLKPTDCVSAAHKLLLLKDKLPERIMQAHRGATCSQSEPVWFALTHILLGRLKEEVSQCAASLARAVRRAPMYGLIHCLSQPLLLLDPNAICSDEQWSALVSDIIGTCSEASRLAGALVGQAAPEGHLPMDTGLVFTDTGNSGGVVTAEGRPVTAQMLLLSAWRTVKEVSLLLGGLVSRLTIQGEGQEHGTLSQDQVIMIGDHFTTLLTESKHRGAFEQAYVGFTQFLARVWQCRSGALGGWGARRVRALARALARPRADPTRRSAGLPFMIQALLITELQVKGNPTCLHECMSTLLKLARATKPEDTNGKTKLNNSLDMVESDSEQDASNKSANMDRLCIDSMVESRTHCMNVLRALFRNSALEEGVAGYVGEGFMVALEGFDRDTWMERNAATLLFSALVARVFGPAGAGAGARGRDTMTGRIFFLRYPALYDYILQKLQEAEKRSEQDLSPGLFPVLTLVGRLYPSALEGVESALRLQALAPRLPPAARAPARPARAAAARAPPALLHPARYIPHMESTLAEISSPSIKRNYCHGLLLQLTRLLEALPQDLVVDDEAKGRLARGIRSSYWILQQAAGRLPCYMIAEEYVKMVNLFIWRFSSYINREREMLNTIKQYLDTILFTEVIPPVTAGREVCLADMAYLYIIILSNNYELSQCSSEENKSQGSTTLEDIVTFIHKCLAHKSYEVVLSALNYLLILSNNLEIDCNFQRHLSSLMANEKVRPLIGQESFTDKLCDLLKRSKYLECIQKTTKILSLEKNTQKYIVEVKLGRKPLNNEEIFKTLINCVQKEHENFTHIYLESLLRFVSSLLHQENVACLSDDLMLDVIRVVFDCCTSENNDNTRRVAADFLQKELWVVLNMGVDSLTPEHKFELQATVYAAVVTCLEDDDPVIRQSVADVLWQARGSHATESGSHVTASGSHATGSGSHVTASGSHATESGSHVTASGSHAMESGSHVTASGSVVASRAATWLRDHLATRHEALPLLTLMALLDFKSEVCMADELSDEIRVFDQNERYNIFLEETVWTSECADKIIELTYNREERSALQCVRDALELPNCKSTFQKLCGDNLVLFNKIIEDSNVTAYKYNVVNPKIEIFVNKLIGKYLF